MWKFKKRFRIGYQNINLNIGFRADLIVDNQLLIEVKALDQLLPVHHAQVITYLKLTRLRTALLINFNVPLLKRRSKAHSPLAFLCVLCVLCG